MWKRSDFWDASYTYYIKHWKIRHALYMYIFVVSEGGGRKRNTYDWFNCTCDITKACCVGLFCSLASSFVFVFVFFFFFFLRFFFLYFCRECPLFLSFTENIVFLFCPIFHAGKIRIVFLFCRMSFFRFFPFSLSLVFFEYQTIKQKYRNMGNG